MTHFKFTFYFKLQIIFILKLDLIKFAHWFNKYWHYQQFKIINRLNKIRYKFKILNNVNIKVII